MENKELGSLYFGKALGDLSIDDLTYISTYHNPSAGVVNFSPNIPNFTLADRRQEYPTYGTSDFREGAINLSRDDEYLYTDFVYESFEVKKGIARNLSFPSAYGDDGEELIIKLVDKGHELELYLSYFIFPQVSAIVRQVQIKNVGKYALTVENLQSSVLSLPNSNYDFLQLSGAWTKERHIKKRPLVQGITKVESLRGASSHQENPFIALVDKNVTNSTGEIYASNLIYSGNFVSQVQVDEWNTTRLMTGINPQQFCWKFEKDESFTSPQAVLFYTSNGYNGLMRQTHSFVKNHIVDLKWKKRKRPIVLNNWEATYFDFNEDKLLNLAKQAKALGIECFVLDDGWFGKRDNDRTSLGNWTVNMRKFPQGLGHFSDQLHALGLQFGLWFEPEMVSPDTEIFKKHPDWIVHHPYERYSVGRGQYVLDFANPEVVDNIYQQMAHILSNIKIDYIKWDMNRNITEAYSPYLKKQRLPQGEFFHRYIQGVYHLYEKLLRHFPDLLIEGCASGGGRFDLGILFYSPQIWPSDDSDALERLDIMQGTLLAYPLSTFSNHVSAVPNDQVKRMTSLSFRQNVACFGPLGYELDLNKLSEKEKEEIKQEIRWYKENRNLLVNGKFDELLSLNNNNTYAWSVSSKRKQIIGFYRKLARPNEELDQYLIPSNIDLNAQYQINDHTLVSGNVLHNFGLREPYQFNAANENTAELFGDFQSYLYQLVHK